MSDIQIYCFSGKSGSGKDFLAGCLRAMLPPNRKSMMLALADHFKIEAMALDHMAYDRIFVRKDIESRSALQLRGTELGRNVHGEDVWVRHLHAWMRAHLERGIDTFFITDNRFENEKNALAALAHNAEFRNPTVKHIRVLAPDRTYARRIEETKGDLEAFLRIANHPSETGLDHLPDSEFDLVVHNDVGEPGVTVIRDFALAQQKRYSHVIFLDLDDTLCECGIHYEECKVQALDLVKQFIQHVQLPETDSFEWMFAQHRKDYEKIEFSRDIFANALVEAAGLCLAKNGLHNHPEASQLYAEVRNIGMQVYNKPFAALPGAVETALWLNALSDVKVVVVTVGERPDQLRKLWQIGLGVLDCQTTLLKSEHAYKSWMAMYPAGRYTMVGDSFVRDIDPALNAGIQTAIQVGPNAKPSCLKGHKVATSFAESIDLIIEKTN